MEDGALGRLVVEACRTAVDEAGARRLLLLRLGQARPEDRPARLELGRMLDAVIGPRRARRGRNVADAPK